MLSSMTGFARKTEDNEMGSLTWEIRTVNHRYLELSLRLPEIFRDKEIIFREFIQAQLMRGKVEATLKYKPGEQTPYDFAINKDVLQKLATIHADIENIFPNMQINFSNILNWQGVLSIKDQDTQTIVEAAQQLLDKTLFELVSFRQREGDQLKQFIETRLSAMQTQINRVKQLLPNAIENERQRVLNKFKEMQLELDPERLEQEVLWLMQKADISEEVSRLNTHIDEVQRVVTEGGVIGRRLDFLMQELNRETNTIASKSIDAAITSAAIELKVLIEQMREQVQNIE